MARQSTCAVCGESIGAGSGTVLEFGDKGRVHTQTCLAKTGKKPRTSPDEDKEYEAA